MAISHNVSFERDLDELRHRMDRAKSRDEHEYYEMRYREVLRERERYYMRSMPVPMHLIDPPSLEQKAIDKMAAEAPKKTELSFLSSADKKLLLIGEMA